MITASVMKGLNLDRSKRFSNILRCGNTILGGDGNEADNLIEFNMCLWASLRLSLTLFNIE